MGKSSKVNKQLCSRFGILISKEAVVLRRWESETKILVLSNELIKVELTPLEDLESRGFERWPFVIRSDER